VSSTRQHHQDRGVAQDFAVALQCGGVSVLAVMPWRLCISSALAHAGLLVSSCGWPACHGMVLLLLLLAAGCCGVLDAPAAADQQERACSSSTPGARRAAGAAAGDCSVTTPVLLLAMQHLSEPAQLSVLCAYHAVSSQCVHAMQQHPVHGVPCNQAHSVALDGCVPAGADSLSVQLPVGVPHAVPHQQRRQL
jgi:hypothetical protein